MNFVPALVSLLLSLTAVALCFINTGLPTWAMPLIALPGWFMGVGSVKKNARTFNMIASFSGALAIGYTIDHHAASFPYFLLLLALTAAVYATRPVFFSRMGYLNALWWEPAMFMLAAGVYVYVNLTVSAGWVGWTAAGLPLFFAGFMAMGQLMDASAFKKTAKHEYGVSEGKTAPDFSLPDQHGATVSLGEYRGKNLVLLLFVRGDWCPTCHIMLRVYERNVAKFKTKDVLVMAIGPDPVGVNREMVKKLDLAYHLLADEKQEALKAYGIQYMENQMGTKYETGIPMPASILVDKSGTVQYISRADRAGEFLNPMRIFDILAKL